MAKKNKNQGQEEPKELTRKQNRANTRDAERNRKIMMMVGGVIGAVLLVLLIGIIAEFVVKPNSNVAKVGDDAIITKDFQKRMYLEESQLENQYLQMVQLEQQFGGQGIFTTQLNQIQSTLASPFALGIDVLDQMIEEKLVEQEAAARGITVSDQEVEDAFRAEIAAGQNAVTEPQATSTAEAAAEATEVAAGWTPTPTPTIDASAPITAADTVVPTPEPQPTLPLLTDASFEEGIDTLEENLDDISGLSVDEYRELIYLRLLTEKVSEAIAEEEVSETEEQVNARHILIREIAAPPETAAATVDDTDDSADDSADEDAEVSSDTPEVETRSLEEAEALANEIYERLQDGEDFAELAAEYSDDLSNAQNGGDLGWFARGQMVAPFEDAAFALAPGEISEPVETQFGFHIIELVERDDTRPKDESALQQERFQAYRDRVQAQIASDDIERAGDLTSKLPDDVATGDIFNLAAPQAPQPPQAPQAP